MAEYGRVGSASDYMKQERALQESRTSRVQKKVTRTTTFDFGRGPYTVEDFKDFYDHIKDLPEGAKCNIQYWDDQRDGQSFKITVNE